jgi:hypothetical protein
MFIFPTSSGGAALTGKAAYCYPVLGYVHSHSDLFPGRRILDIRVVMLIGGWCLGYCDTTTARGWRGRVFGVGIK